MLGISWPNHRWRIRSQVFICDRREEALNRSAFLDLRFPNNCFRSRSGKSDKDLSGLELLAMVITGASHH